jgi:TetR/AcrR family transcriptional regulator, transcriptional repressor for nem operon
MGGDKQPVGRPRSFDEDKALEAAAECFWAHGFEATSVRDLTCSMGIAGPSLYNAYGGKRGLYAAALDHYCKRSMRERIARLDKTMSGAEAIEAFFADVVEKSLGHGGRKGCFLVNAALEVAPHDPGLGQAIQGYVAEIANFFKRHIAAGQAQGTVCPQLDPDLYAAHLTCVLMGLRVLARSAPSGSVLEAAVSPALERLRLPCS